MFGHTDVRIRGLFPKINSITVLLLAFILTPVTLFPSQITDTEILPHGTWGGRGAELRVGENQAIIEFDCAFARISTSIEIQPGGEFSVEGLYFREPGGPGRAGDADPPGTPAVFSGFRAGSEIHLTVQLKEKSRRIGPFVLYESQQSQLEKCL